MQFVIFVIWKNVNIKRKGSCFIGALSLHIWKNLKHSFRIHYNHTTNRKETMVFVKETSYMRGNDDIRRTGILL